MNQDQSKTNDQSKQPPGGEALTVAEMCERLGPLNQSAHVLISLGSTTPLLFAVTGVLTPSQYDFSQIFNIDAGPPDDSRVFLTIRSFDLIKRRS